MTQRETTERKADMAAAVVVEKKCSRFFLFLIWLGSLSLLPQSLMLGICSPLMQGILSLVFVCVYWASVHVYRTAARKLSHFGAPSSAEKQKLVLRSHLHPAPMLIQWHDTHALRHIYQWG